MCVARVLRIVTICVLFSGVVSARERPNILLVLTDDQRSDALGCSGHPWLETPNMDRLARNGVLFENAFVTTSLCSPSRASILTGLYAHNHQVIDNYHPVAKDLKFFPEHLQEAGYQTAFIGKWHMGGEQDEPQRGFDHWISFKGQGIYFPDPSRAKVKGRFVPQVSNTGFNINGRRVAQKGYITDELTDFALQWLKTQEAQEAPFFLYLSHKAVHADFLPANRHAFAYEDKPFTPPKSWFEQPERFRDVPMWVQNQRNSRHGVEFAYYSNLDLATYYRRYCETLKAVDESLGRILSLLEETGQLDSTLILFLGDNGFLFGEHGLIDKRCAYEESMRIPMIMHYPKRFAKNTKVREIVANIDVAPTLLSAAGVEIPGDMDGMSFLPLAEGKTNSWRQHLLYEYFWERNYPQTPTMHALRGQRFKYIRYHGIWDNDELYDLIKDPRETTNLIAAPDYQDVVQDLNQRLFKMLRASSGMQLRMLPDRGTKFLHRKRSGSPAAAFPESFLRDPD